VSLSRASEVAASQELAQLGAIIVQMVRKREAGGVPIENAPEWIAWGVEGRLGVNSVISCSIFNPIPPGYVGKREARLRAIPTDFRPDRMAIKSLRAPLTAPKGWPPSVPRLATIKPISGVICSRHRMSVAGFFRQHRRPSGIVRIAQSRVTDQKHPTASATPHRFMMPCGQAEIRGDRAQSRFRGFQRNPGGIDLKIEQEIQNHAKPASRPAIPIRPILNGNAPVSRFPDHLYNDRTELASSCRRKATRWHGE